VGDAQHETIGFAGLAYLFLVCLWLPWAVFKSTARAKDAFLRRRELYFVNALATGAFIGALALLTAWREGIELFPRQFPPVSAIAWGAATLAVLVLGMSRYWEYVARHRQRRMQLFVDTTPRERALWVAVSTSAGFWEEIVYRGVTYTLLARLSGSSVLAVAVTAIAFSIAHYNRGKLGATLILFIGLALQGLVYLAGSLYVAMAVHLCYDVAAGFGYMRLAKKYGIARELPPEQAAAAPAQ
jgi:membrane protease YdiL (CAAX protease family)